MEEETNTDKSPYEHLKKYHWKKGKSGNPKGRPKGKLSPIDSIRKMFEKNPDDFHEFLTDYLNDKNNKKHIVEMLDGKPAQAVDHTTDGKPISVHFAPVFNKDVSTTQKTGGDNK